MDGLEGPLIKIGHRKGRPVRSETIRCRVTPATKAELRQWSVREDRDESEMVRILLGEALAERARKYRTR